LVEWIFAFETQRIVSRSKIYTSLTTPWDNAPYLVLGIRRTPEESSTIFMPITAAKSPKKA
jgi:hypothetical protein